MSWLKRLLRLRRQSDRVKIALLLYLLALVMGADLARKTWTYFTAALGPKEYVWESTAPLPETTLEQLRQQEGMGEVSRQRVYPLEREGKALQVTELDPQYLAVCYGITGQAGEKVWLNPAAYLLLFGQGGEGAVGFTLTESLPGEEPFAVSRGTSATLGDSLQLRVRLSRGAGSKEAQEAIEAMGLVLVNREELITREYEARLLTERLWYGLPAIALALWLGSLLFRQGARTLASPSPPLASPSPPLASPSPPLASPSPPLASPSPPLASPSPRFDFPPQV